MQLKQVFFIIIIAIGIYNVGRPTSTVALCYITVFLYYLYGGGVTEAIRKKEGREVLLELLFYFLLQLHNCCSWDDHSV